MQKAWRATESAQLLLKSGDTDGACNRAYYAIFDAARATLLALHPEIETRSIKSHSGLISAFSLHVVKPGLIAVDHGRAFNRVHDIRLLADYTDEPIPAETVRGAIEQAIEFVGAAEELMRRSPSAAPDRKST